MKTSIEGKSTIDVYAAQVGQVCIKQKTDSEAEQTVVLDLNQAEKLANWLQDYIVIARESLTDE